MIPALARWNGDHAMTRDTTKETAVAGEVLLFDNWFDAIEDGERPDDLPDSDARAEPDAAGDPN